MRKLTILPVTFALLVAAPRMGHALILSHALTTYTASPDVLFDSTLGRLLSVSLEIKFETGTIYETPYSDRTLGSVAPFDVTFSGQAPLVVFGTTDRQRLFDWSMPGHGEGGSGSPFYWATGSGPSVQTYTAAEVLDFFTFHEGDEGFAFYGWNEWISCSPDVIFDSLFNPYLWYNAHTDFGDGIVLTYNYEAPAPVPEASTTGLLGVGAILLVVSGLRRVRRNTGRGESRSV